MHSYFDFNVQHLNELSELPLFERNEGTERYLDDRQLLLERSHSKSVNLYCRRLEIEVIYFNENKFYRSKLINFIESHQDDFIFDMHRDWPNDDYLQKLTLYIKGLREILGINVNFPHYSRDNLLIDKIASSLKLVDFDVNKIKLSLPTWIVGSNNFGKVLTNRSTIIYLINNLNALTKNSLIPGSYVFITIPISNEQLDDFLLKYFPSVIICRSKSGMLKHKNFMNFLFKEIYAIRSLTNDFLKKKYLSDDAQCKLPSVIVEIGDLEVMLHEYEDDLNLKIKGELKYKTRFIYEKIKRLQLKVGNLHFDDRNSVRVLSSKLQRLASQFAFIDELESRVSQLPYVIYNGIKNITTNSNLYRVTNEICFNENNLSAALLTWMKASLPTSFYHFQQEDPTSNGRTDISIYHNGEIVSFIESKLIQSHSSKTDVQKKVKQGIYQIYMKYSDSVTQTLTMPPDTYFVLFCFNPHYREVRDNISKALIEISGEHSRLKIKRLEDPNNMWIRFRLEECGGSFPDKVVNVNLIIAALRTKDNKDEQHGKYKI
ncbi:hypothetical protein [Pantoea sp. 3_1284]|uniref:hypothetical protein n=1 Tax=Pantoea sp. 3_1284 TaxID=2259618 RepID=UPI0011BDCFA9|nr:hypothetical protein [Pantoea sp. 3_1284]